MEFHSSLAESHDLAEACDAVASELRRQLGDGPLDLAVVFASADYGAALDALPVMLQERIHARTLVGCTGAAQLHATCMSERPPAISVIAGRMPGAKLAASVVTAGDLPHADAPPADWRRLLPELGAAPRALLVLGEPFHFDMRPLLAGLDYALPEAHKVGGLASGSQHPDGNALFCGRARVNQGAVLLGIGGDVEARSVVAQGCRPIGRAGRVTKADRNRLATVDDLPVKTFIQQQLQELPPEQLELADGNPLFLGVASDPFAMEDPTAGEFLVRNVLGIDEEGRLVVGEHLSVGRTVQLHLRDRDGGLDDLEGQLRRAGADEADAALIFRCVGREGADHERFRHVAPDVPLAGCTCNGEIGPVGAVTHMHGYTASCLLLREGAPS